MNSALRIPHSAFRRLVALLLLCAFVPSLFVSGATLTGTITKANGQPYASSTVRFRTTSTPVLLGDGSIGTGGDYDFTTDTNGVLSATVIAGIYRVFVGSDRNFLVDVPDSTNSYSIASRITNSLATFTTSIPATNGVPLASASDWGKVKTDVTEADPIVYTKASVDALLATNTAPGKLDITNGVAVALSGSLTNVTIGGTSYYSGLSANNVFSQGSFFLGVRPGSSNTHTLFPSVHTVETIADLQSRVSTELTTTNSTVEVQGYYTPNDGGGGQFYYIPHETADNGITFDAGSGSYSWRRVVKDYITPEMFGAKGDGTTDDTAAVNAAETYAAANNLVLRATKQYKLGTSALLLHNNTVVDGAGTGQFIRAFAGNGTYTNTWGTLQNHPIALIGSYTNAAEVQVNTTNITLRNLKILNADANVYTNGRSLALWGVRGVVLENCFIGPIANGWAADIWADEGVVSGCIITNVAEVFSDGFHLIGGRRWTITGNQFYGGDDALALLQVYDHSMSDVTVSGNYLRSYKAHAIRIGRWDEVSPADQTNAMERIIVSGNVCEAGWRNGGVFIEDQVVSGTNYTKLLRDIMLVNNTILMRSDFATGGVTNGYGIKVNGAKDITIQNLIVTNAYLHSQFNNTAGTLLLDNVKLRNNSLFSAYFEGCENIQLNNADLYSDRLNSLLRLVYNDKVRILNGRYEIDAAAPLLSISAGTGQSVEVVGADFLGSASAAIYTEANPDSLVVVGCNFESSLGSRFDFLGGGSGGTKPTQTEIVANINQDNFIMGDDATFAGSVVIEKSGFTPMLTFSRTDSATTGYIDMTGGYPNLRTSQNYVGINGALGALFYDTRTDNANKTVRLTMLQYDRDAAGLTLLRGATTTSDNTVSIGGGTSLQNAATLVSTYTAANTTTTTGTEQFRVDSTSSTTSMPIHINVNGSITRVSREVNSGTLYAGGSGAPPSYADVSTIQIPASAMTPFATDGATAVTTTLATTGLPIDEYSFDASTDKKVAVKVTFPPGWNGTTLTATFKWRTTATSGNCVWGIQARYARDGDNIDTTFGTAVTVTDGAQGTANYQSISSATGTITPSGTFASGCSVYFIIYRDADNGSDTLASAALLDDVILTWK